MESDAFLHNSALDQTIRNKGFWPYPAVYTAAGLLAFSLDVPAPFEIPLFAQHERSSAASAWAFLVSYPVFHALLKPRLYRTYARLLHKFTAAMLGTVLVLLILVFLHFPFPDEPVTRVGRALAHPLGASLFLFSASITLSTGGFLLLEPLRERVSRWLS